MGPVPEGWEIDLYPAAEDDPYPYAAVHIPQHGCEYVYAMSGVWLADGAWWRGMESEGAPEPAADDRHPTLVAALAARWRREAAEYEARARYLVALAERFGEAAP
jgi:hypothetical protein